MPLYLAASGDEIVVKHVGGNAETKKHLNDLGFVVGETVKVISSIGGNLIVDVKNSRIAIDREMAAKIMI